MQGLSPPHRGEETRVNRGKKSISAAVCSLNGGISLQPLLSCLLLALPGSHLSHGAALQEKHICTAKQSPGLGRTKPGLRGRWLCWGSASTPGCRGARGGQGGHSSQAARCWIQPQLRGWGLQTPARHIPALHVSAVHTSSLHSSPCTSWPCTSRPHASQHSTAQACTLQPCTPPARSPGTNCSRGHRALGLSSCKMRMRVWMWMWVQMWIRIWMHSRLPLAACTPPPARSRDGRGGGALLPAGCLELGAQDQALGTSSDTESGCRDTRDHSEHRCTGRTAPRLGARQAAASLPARQLREKMVCSYIKDSVIMPNKNTAALV